MRFIYLRLFFVLVLGGATLIACDDDTQKPVIEDLSDIDAIFTQKVEASNYCEVDNDCVLIYPGCPLGCGVAVGEEYQENVRDFANQLIKEYNQTHPACAYSCLEQYTVCYIDTCQVRNF